MNPIFDQYGKVGQICTISTEITETKRLELENKIMAESRTGLLDLQRDFISRASHEFRTPLAALRGALYLMRKRLPTSVDEKFNRYLQLQSDALDSLTKLVDEFLLLSRIEYATFEAELTPLNLTDLLRSICDQFNDSDPSPRVSLQLKSTPHPRLRLNEGLIRAAVCNLVSNALKYSPPSEIVVVALEHSPDGWTLGVKDRGCGIPVDDRARLFSPFFRARNVGTVAGSGLGLAIVKRAVELHGGTVCFESAENAGSTFQIKLPVMLMEGNESEITKLS